MKIQTRKALLRSFLLPLILPAALLGFWAVMASILQMPIILPAPEAVFSNLVKPHADILAMGSLFYNLGFSLARVLVGFSLAVLIGIPFGILMGYSKLADRLFMSSIALLRAIPPLAWVPVILAWCGMLNLAGILNIPIGPFYTFAHNIKLSMICIIFIGAFYPILTSAAHGVQQVPATLVESATMLGAGRGDIFRTILLPASIPSIVSGMRIALGMAWMCVVAAEMMPGTPIGIGFMIMHAFTIGRTDVVITGMACIGLISSLMDWLFRHFEARFLFWKKENRMA
jgi:NitT/TauT family transport system permease protein